MNLEKIWINKKEPGNNVVIFHNDVLYRRKVKEDKFSIVEGELNTGSISDKFII